MGAFLEGPRNLTVRRTYFENLNLRNYTAVLSFKPSLFDFFLPGVCID